MTVALFKDGFPSAHRTTRQHIESSLDLRRLFFAIDADPALIGAGVVYIDGDFNVVVLREFQAICRVQPIKLVLREAPRYVGPMEFKLKQAARNAPKRIPATQIKPIIATHRNDSIAAALGLASSGMSGNTKTLAIGIYEEFSE